MTLNEGMLYGKRQSFVFLRYVAMFFFTLTLIASYFVIVNALTQATKLLNSLTSVDMLGILQALTSFKLEGQFGVFIETLRNLSAVVIPLYFVATVTFVFNLNHGKMGSTIRRVAIIAFLMFIAELLIYTVIVGMVTLLVQELFNWISSKYTDITEAVYEILVAINIDPDILPTGSVAEMIAGARTLVTDKLVVMLLKNIPSFNIYLDQLLCLLMCFFFCTRPKWVNNKFKLFVFRSLGLLPIAYVIATFVLNGLTRSGEMPPKILILCLFPSKALPHYVFIFSILVAFRRHRRRPLPYDGPCKFSPDGKKWLRPTTLIYETADEAASRALDTATYLSIWLLFLAGVDFFLGSLSFASNWGFGKSYYALFAIPFLFFFDANKPVLKKEYNGFSLMYMFVIFMIVLVYLFV